ncbi:dTMP kinase [PVC group bacterium]|nr:dTMP kinase [PVC group bacterium]
MADKGLFITFEGPEASGKSTQAAILVERLRASGYEVLTTREPGGTLTGEAIRGILQHDTAGEAPCPESETLLFEASRAQLVRNVIRPALQRGAVVVCDRFADSTTAYQGYGRGFDIEQVLSMNAFALGGTNPDVTILIEIDVKEGFERLEKRNRKEGAGFDRMERESLDFHEKVNAGYFELAKRFPERYEIVNGHHTEDSVHKAIWQIIEPKLPNITVTDQGAR